MRGAKTESRVGSKDLPSLAVDDTVLVVPFIIFFASGVDILASAVFYSVGEMSDVKVWASRTI